MSKETHNYHAIEEFRPKAVKVRLAEGDRNAVWLPRARIALDEDAGVIAATPKLWADKDADRNRDFSGERKARDNEIIALAAPAWESPRAIGIDCLLVEVNIESVRRVRFFVPRNLYSGGGCPHWYLSKKARELAEERGVPGGMYEIEGLRADGAGVRC